VSGSPTPTSVQIRPSALTGPGWATVVIYVSGTTTYSFYVSASVQQSTPAQGKSVNATLTVSPTGLQPDFVLSTTTARLALTQNTAVTLPVIIDAVDN